MPGQIKLRQNQHLFPRQNNRADRSACFVGTFGAPKQLLKRLGIPPEDSMASEKTLSDAFYETLKDVYWAEKQAVKACKKSAKAAKSPELQKAFQSHGVESEGHVERLQQVFEIIGRPARAKTCEAMQGITAEMEEDLEDFGNTEAGDAVLIGCGQAVEHYEIARYGMLKAWAGQLGMKDAAKLLDQTLQEEKKADALLTKIAEGSVNAQAAA
jgi:ferritin-like metal-binding protein YciE